MTLLIKDLTAERGLIFRITHRSNIQGIIRSGVCCASSPDRDPEYVQIGNPDLIASRSGRVIETGRPLSDYIPFYFTPASPMLLNILTGRGVTKRQADEIIILVSSIDRLIELGIEFVISDRHAYLNAARFTSDRAELIKLPWEKLQQRDFKRDPEDPESFERYQAEALILERLPLSGILGLACYTKSIAVEISESFKAAGKTMQVLARPKWYFQ